MLCSICSISRKLTLEEPNLFGFLDFVAFILYGAISKVMGSTGISKDLSVQELMYELKKIKRINGFTLARKRR